MPHQQRPLVQDETTTTSTQILQQPLSTVDMDRGSAKRQATKGQWQTPPVGEFFPSATAPAEPGVNLAVGTLRVPNTSDDYALALQEAYRRGAEAAAAMSIKRSSQLPSPTASMNGNVAIAPGNPITTTSAPMQQQVAEAPSAVTSTAVSTNMGVPTPLAFLESNSATTSAAPFLAPQAEVAQTQTLGVAGVAPHSTVPQQPVPINIDPTPIVPENVISRPIDLGNQSSMRSFSMPDMSSLNKADDEESKRLKRLARNRASARLRRLRKKNLVESYEAEVGVLESSLAKLKAHKWGVGADSDALLEALSMDRGQQQIDAQKRKELITTILAQQREQVRTLMDCQMENMTLAWIAQHEEDGSEAVDGTGDADMGNESTKDELDDLASELNQILDLSPDQKKQLQLSTVGIEEERHAIQVIDASLTALMSNSWLMNKGVEECTEKVTEILNPTQMSKFLLWADHNSEAIDELDYVNAPAGDAPPSANPTFVFGIDETNTGED